MQSLQCALRRLVSYNKIPTSISESLCGAIKPAFIAPCCSYFEVPTHFTDYNKKIYPPQKPDEPRRPAYVCHLQPHVKYSLKKMWYIACFVRGMSVDEAIKQLSYLPRKGASIVKDTILEAQEMAVADHNVEFKSNLWVAESFCVKSAVIKGVRRHAKARVGKVRYGYLHYFVRLEEGKPPKHYYEAPKSSEQLLENWVTSMRMRKVTNSL